MAAAPNRRARFELVDGPLPPRDEQAGSPTRGRGGRGGSGPLLALTVAAVLVLVAAVVLPDQAGNSPTPDPSAAATSRPTPTPTNLGARARCDLADAGCRVVTAARWRDRTAAILRERLDPENRYFTGYSYSVSPLYNTGSRLDALGLEVYRLEGGSTEVFIQIARSRDVAIRCGQLTQHRCVGQRFMDGNRFTLTPTTSAAEGAEVQYRPTGTYVITLVARNVTGGTGLPVSTGDLMRVAMDPRLAPPPR